MTDNKHLKSTRVKSDWVEDAVKLQRSPLWTKRIAVIVTSLSCILYVVLYALVSGYRERVTDVIRDLPIFTRVVLNIYQPFLMVFIIISLSLFILLWLKIKKPWLSAKSLMILIVFNCLFAATLLIVSSLKVA